MKKLICGLTLAGLVVGMIPMSAAAQGRIVAYFNSRGTQRRGNSPGVGEFSVLFIYGEGFEAEFITGVQYKVDYGPQLNFVADLGLPPVAIGTSATGLSVGFGAPRPGGKFVIHSALVEWVSDCATLQNQDIWTGPHPDFPDPTPIVTRYPDFDIVTAEGVRSQTCQLLELDIHPGSCPNPIAANKWIPAGSQNSNGGGVLPVALFGSESFDLNDIVLSSLRLEGVKPLSQPPIRFQDVGGGDADNDCTCDVPGTMDGIMDISMKFRNTDIAHAIGAVPPPNGTVVTMTLTGVYTDGMPFSATDCMVVVGNVGKKIGADGVADLSTNLGNPSPNPFNPVTWISYSIPSTQHVRIAIYDVAGRLVENLVNEVKTPGEYTVEWDAANRPSGVYFYRMQTGDQTIVRRATLLK